VTSVTLVLLDRPLIRGDGIAYLGWVDSIALDGDIDLSNQAERLAPVNTYQIQWNETTGRWVIIFPFGVALLQTPFYYVGHLAAANQWLDVNSDYFQQMQGVGLPYSLSVMLGANVLALGSVTFAWLAGRKLCNRWLAALVTYAVFLGTPLVYYSTITPLNSHSAGAFALAIYFYVLLTVAPSKNQAAREHGWHWYVMLGVSAGLAILARWQLALVVAPGWLLLMQRRQWRGVLLATVSAGLISLPLPLVWQELFGSPFLIPFDAVEGQRGAGSFLGQANHALEVLGMTLLHSPVIVLSLVGIAVWWRQARGWALLAAGIIGLQLLINGAALDWWAGESYGMRRMSELFALYALLGCLLIGAVASHPTRWVRRLLPLVYAAVIIYTGVYIAAFLVYSWTNPDGYLLGSPDVMLGYFFAHSYRWDVLVEVVRTHVGPWAWSMPGP
jgi:4-amino-4-deoxy-L-arabinose transferase-like glycosyltransferase